MTYGVSKRDRLARRGDKRWRSTWHRQMLSMNRTRPIDKRDGIGLDSRTNIKSLSDRPTTLTKETNNE